MTNDLLRLLDRRDFVLSAAAAVPAAWSALDLARGVGEEEKRPASLRLIPRQKSPVNLESPFAGLGSFITPNDLFYVRSHFPQPSLDRRTWKVNVEGAVEHPLALTYDDLRKLPRRSKTATLECAGNGRAFLQPKAKGVQWELGAVSNARWTGVALNAVLDRAGASRDAVEVILEGADQGEINDDPKPAGPIHFARSLPMSKARQDDVLLAYEMNGVELPAAHGFPARAIVPGWFGVASVKWLRRIIVARRPFNGFFQSIDYSYFQVIDGRAKTVPITQTQVKAQIARPAAGEVVPVGAMYKVRGAAWTGESDVSKVEVSADGGASWGIAQLVGKAERHAWRLWEYSWRAPERPGPGSLLARATDARGQSQPASRDRNRRNYMINHPVAIPFQVK